jgi:hypothetical protein
MKYKVIIMVLVSLSLLGGSPYLLADGDWLQKLKDSLKQDKPTGSQASTAEIGEAFKQALQIGADNVVSRLGSVDGFNADPQIHIPLPRALQTVKELLSPLGMAGQVEELEIKLNRAAEAATPKTKELFMKSISEMTFQDVHSIYQGGDDAATRYFQQKMSGALAIEMRPIVDESLSNVGAITSLDNVMRQYQTLPMVPNVKTDLTQHVVDKGMDGIFHYLALEEAAIRKNPLKQTTALLKKVFGKG